MAAIPNYLRQWREAHGMTQAQLAAAVGVDKTTVSKWETLDREVADEHKKLLGAYFGIPVSAIFEFEWTPHNEALRKMAGVLIAIRQEVDELREVVRARAS